jgi:hypothetical protein
MRFPRSLLIAVTALALAPLSAAAIEFTSTFESIKVQTSPGKTVTRNFTLHLAAGDSRARFAAKIEDWWESEDGSQAFYRPVGTLPRSCGGWITIDPVESIVDAGGTLTVRVTTNVPREAKPGGYWCVLTLDELSDPLAASPGGVGLQFVASVSAGIFVYLNPVVRDVRVAAVDVSAREAHVTLRNAGNAPVGVDGRFEILRAGSAETVASVPFARTTVLTEPAARRRLSVRLPDLTALPAGRYLVRVVLDLGLDHDIGVEKELRLPDDLKPPPTGH